MPTNANTYNTRITSEALEAAFRERFPAQGGAELVDDLYASGVIQPVFDLATTTSGGALPQQLQTAWDFSTGSILISNATSTIISNTGFWKVGVSVTMYPAVSTNAAQIRINDGSTTKAIWGINTAASGAIQEADAITNDTFVVFLRSGDTLEGVSATGGTTIDVWYRQIADVNGNLVNPLGFTFS